MTNKCIAYFRCEGTIGCKYREPKYRNGDGCTYMITGSRIASDYCDNKKANRESVKDLFSDEVK